MLTGASRHNTLRPNTFSWLLFLLTAVGGGSRLLPPELLASAGPESPPCGWEIDPFFPAGPLPITSSLSAGISWRSSYTSSSLPPAKALGSPPVHCWIHRSFQLPLCSSLHPKMLGFFLVGIRFRFLTPAASCYIELGRESETAGELLCA